MIVTLVPNSKYAGYRHRTRYSYLLAIETFTSQYIRNQSTLWSVSSTHIWGLPIFL
ncbi:uncharacterized protein EI90DRAFT_3053247 [Cantharellus anzutake]|uniref:uncharacterized protein n=1 Tax=Cantharellus anzutake TaxID=1750568 RepID=UPI001903D57A|nr:uncharacterized protein EI90DRAFT_3090736 [Cantharellus anzutake]XP_038917334.1 uncharacterized protein EI90DRAFT_3053247 [Cantharellus anzutake]KAF8314349.1 hypothetical protein EI90DRAFT_3090736 [Cantharellus anzutake]KAF8333181.1 hypothetical protein EI90DRAFT_3053247 [Cantharellus anzutake]